MKMNGIFLWIIVILAVSCTRSRFATTTRHFHDGKVVYSNHYPMEKRNLHRNKIKRTAAKAGNEAAKIPGYQVKDKDPVDAMIPIASSGYSMRLHRDIEKPAGPRTNIADPEFTDEKGVTPSKPCDQKVNKGPETATFKDNIRKGDTTVKKDNSKNNPPGKKKTDGPKTEKLGLAGFILSFLGLVPLFGIPFAILAIVFGAKSLGRIKRNPGKYKGKGFATASIVIGSLMILMNIIILIAGIGAAASTPAPSYNASAVRCRV